MNKQQSNPGKTDTRKPPLSLWAAIALIIIFMIVIVALFGALVYTFTQGVQQAGLSVAGQIAVFVIISGIFAWLLKRISDAVSGMSHLWFPEESEDQD